jgi:hypothetical protein
LFWEKNTGGWLLVAGLFWEKNTVGWWLISQMNKVGIGHTRSKQYLNYQDLLKQKLCDTSRIAA